ncbi:PREDICTED: uncharacterized protein DDB_G0283697-like [Branchiostoma belcheri]|uniref:Uncharacterized protein DDB_G0283697-like n=1 Tax=Branchiostoma belcheri TaxID=7741 RepID=A0A6P4XSP8_BRABE|nr:PREDICTED: uncharacterized protein DDB_G0283697-like [Branchiostoma belcheri]
MPALSLEDDPRNLPNEDVNEDVNSVVQISGKDTLVEAIKNVISIVHQYLFSSSSTLDLESSNGLKGSRPMDADYSTDLNDDSKLNEAMERAKEEAMERAKEEAMERAKEEAMERAKEEAMERAKEEAMERAKEEAMERAKERTGDGESDSRDIIPNVIGKANIPSDEGIQSNANERSSDTKLPAIGNFLPPPASRRPANEHVPENNENIATKNMPPIADDQPVSGKHPPQDRAESPSDRDLPPRSSVKGQQARWAALLNNDIAVLDEVKGLRRGHGPTRARKQQQGDHPPGFRLGEPQSNATEKGGKTTQSGKTKEDDEKGRRETEKDKRKTEKDKGKVEKDEEKERGKTEKGRRATKKGEEKDRRKTKKDDEKHRRKTEQDNEKERRKTEKDDRRAEKGKEKERGKTEKDKEKDRRPEADRDKRKDRRRTESRNMAKRTRKDRHTRKRTGSSIRTTRQGSRSNRRKCAFQKDAKQTQQMDAANNNQQNVGHFKGEIYEDDGKLSYFRNTNITSQNGVDSYNSTQTVNSSRRHSRRLIARKRRRQCFRRRGRKRRRHNASKSKGRKGQLRQVKHHLTKTLSNKEDVVVVTPVTSPPSHNNSTTRKQAVFGTVNNSHKESVSPKVPLDSCPENRTTNSPNLPLNVRSVCPWSYYIDHDPDRFPYDILQARCRCTACLDTTTGRQNYNYVCVPVTIQKLVSRRKKKKSGRGYRYRNEWVDVAVGCTCVNPRYSP